MFHSFVAKTLIPLLIVASILKRLRKLPVTLPLVAKHYSTVAAVTNCSYGPYFIVGGLPNRVDALPIVRLDEICLFFSTRDIL